jgi:hypothetical protein
LSALSVRLAADAPAAGRRCDHRRWPSCGVKRLVTPSRPISAIWHRRRSRSAARALTTPTRASSTSSARLTDRARAHLSHGQRQIASVLGCELERLDAELDTLAARAKSRALKLRITGDVRDRARNGRYAFVHERGRDFAAGIWVVDPAFILDLVHEQLGEGETAPAREEAYFAGARIDDDELRDAAAEDEQRRAQARARHAEATRSNLGPVQHSVGDTAEQERLQAGETAGADHDHRHAALRASARIASATVVRCARVRACASSPARVARSTPSSALVRAFFSAAASISSKSTIPGASASPEPVRAITSMNGTQTVRTVAACP